MPNLKKRHLIIFTNKKISPDQISFVRQIPATADVVTDFQAVASKVETTLVDLIIIIEDKEKDRSLIENLRRNTKVDEVPILSFNSIEEATKIVPLLVKSKLNRRL
jgi:hypothetical protein